MNIIIFGAAGFIGTNLTLALAKNEDNFLTLVDIKKEYFSNINVSNYKNVQVRESEFSSDTNFDELLSGQDIVYHLVSTTVPTTSNQHIASEISANVVATSQLLEACVRCGVRRVIFISSGGTVYGKDKICPINENTTTEPITSYGAQKVMIEKLLYLYGYMRGLDYRIIRLANPYGPYQRPNGIQGAVTTFTYKALKGEEIVVYGDGTVIRDFIYIDDAINGILAIASSETAYKLYNLGSGQGTSIKQLLSTIEEALGVSLKVNYTPARTVDVPSNYLDISRYKEVFDVTEMIPLSEGIKKTAEFMKEFYK